MGITGGNKPLQGDPLEAAHAAVPAGAVDGELYVAAPTTAPVVTDTGSGVVSFTSGEYHITFAIRNPVTDAILGETESGSGQISNTISPDNEVVDITAIPVSPNDHVNCRRIYRNSGGGGTFRLVGEILDNITTIFTDNALDTTSQPAMPTTNTTGQTITADVASGNAIFIGREAGTERVKVDSNGLLQKGGFNPAHPYGFADATTTIVKRIGGAGALTYTVTSGKIFVISALNGSGVGVVGINFRINQGAGAVPLAVTTTALAQIDWELHNPILADAGDVLSSSSTTTDSEFTVTGCEITRTGGVLPIILATVVQNSGSQYEVPASKVFVLLGVTAGDGVAFGVDGSTGVPYPPSTSGNSMVYDVNANIPDIRNKISTPMILTAGAIMGGTELGINMWGYEIDV